VLNGDEAKSQETLIKPHTALSAIQRERMNLWRLSN